MLVTREVVSKDKSDSSDAASCPPGQSTTFCAVAYVQIHHSSHPLACMKRRPINKIKQEDHLYNLWVAIKDATN